MFAILPAILLLMGIVELFVAPKAKQQIRAELTQTTTLLANSIQENASIAIRERLKYIAEVNRNYAKLLFAEIDEGLRSREEAVQLLRDHLHAQRIGDTGYIYCVTSKMILDVHPSKEMEGKIVPDDRIAIRQLKLREGYMEYEWQNPGEPASRAKALYSLYFEPLDWFISVSCYRSEFVSLLNSEDFRSAVQALHFGNTGYAYIFDTSGEILIHPQFKSFNILKQNALNGDFVRTMISQKQGIIEYDWTPTPGKPPKRKISAFQRLRDIDWIVASSAYTDEVFAPVLHLRMIIYGGIFMLATVAGTLAYFLSRRITRPLEEMVAQLENNSNESKNDPIIINNRDEIGKVAAEFNRYLAILKMRDEALRNEQQRLKNITENSPGIFYQFTIGKDCTPQLLYISGKCQEIVQLESSTDSFLQQLASRLLESDQGIFWESLKSAIQQKTHWYFEGRFKRENGALIWLHAAASPQEMNDSLTYNGFLMDISERKQLEEQIHHIQKMDAIGQLAGGVAHDFNNMLGGIIGAAELIQMHDKENSKIAASVQLILSAASRAADLTTKLLAFSRKGKLENTFVDIKHVIHDSIALLEHTLDRNVKISFQEDASNTIILGDFSQLQNIFINLGINAGHAMPEGGELSFVIQNVELEQHYCDNSQFDLTPGIYVQVAVRDTGCGIPPENLSHIFEPFFTTRKLGKGTGLGLSAVFGAVQQHHGAITVYTEQNRGTVFHIEFPIAQTESDEKVEPQNPVMGEGHILVVDDESILRLTAKASLESLGYTVLLAEDGIEAIEIYKSCSSSIDLVLLDMVMPKMNGRECFKQLRSINPEAKIILASGFSQEKDVHTMMQEGLAGFIRKPYRKWELSRMIAKVLK